MRRLIAIAVVAIGSLASGSTTFAQGYISVGPPVYIGSPVTTYYSSSYVAPYSTYVAPYSYYSVRSGPARIYEGYGTNDFPFYGQPYGNPSDPWSWQSLSGATVRDLSRYYYPPVR